MYIFIDTRTASIVFGSKRDACLYKHNTIPQSNAVVTSQAGFTKESYYLQIFLINSLRLLVNGPARTRSVPRPHKIGAQLKYLYFHVPSVIWGGWWPIPLPFLPNPPYFKNTYATKDWQRICKFDAANVHEVAAIASHQNIRLVVGLLIHKRK